MDDHNLHGEELDGANANETTFIMSQCERHCKKNLLNHLQLTCKELKFYFSLAFDAPQQWVATLCYATGLLTVSVADIF